MRQQPAVDRDRLPGDVGCVLGREEEHQSGDLGGVPEPPERDAVEPGLDPAWHVPQMRSHCGVADHARADRVGAHAVARIVECQRAGEVD